MNKKTRKDILCKASRRIKIAVSLLIITFSQVYASNGYSQIRQFSINASNETIGQVIEKIEKQTGYTFLYNNKITDIERKVNLNADTRNIDEILQELFKNTSIIYTIKDNQIILTDANAKLQNKETKQNSPDTPETIIVKGTIIDEKGEPVIGANVSQKGTGNGTISDYEGKFSIRVPKGSTISVSYIGYIAQNLKASDENLSIILKENSQMLGEVVVTAMGIERKSESLTYATQTVGGNELTRAKEANLINSLQGKSAGLVITPNTGGAGSASKILLRGNASMLGNNSPLIVIDGVPMLNSVSSQMGMGDGELLISEGSGEGGDGLSQLNPDDIESITILKGANSAALYGSAASNGVLMITTKKGKEGSLRIDFSSNTTFETPLVLPKLQNVYGSEIKGNEANGYTIGATSWGGKLSDMTASQLDPANSRQRLTNNAYNIADFFNTGSTYNNTISFSGGTQKVQSYFSYGNTTSMGIIPTNKFYRHNITLRENFSFFKDKLKINFSANYINQKGKNRPQSGVIFSPLFNLYTAARNADMNYYRQNYVDYNGKWNSSPYDVIVKIPNPDNPSDQLTILKPGFVSELSDNKYGKQIWYMQDAPTMNNPWWLLNRVTNESISNRVFGNISADYQIIDNLSLQARIKYDRNSGYSESRQYATTMLPEAMNDRGRWLWGTSFTQDFYGDFMLSYYKDIKDFHLNVNAGGSMMNSRSNRWFLTPPASSGAPYQEDKSVNQFNLGDIYIKGGGPNDGITQGGLEVSDWTRAIFATAQLSYKDKATIEGSYRDDWYRAFTQFRNMKKHYPYFSFGANSILTNIWEMPRSIDELKVRLSYSEVGNSIPNSLFLSSASRNPATGAYIMSGIEDFKNPKPETTVSVETGFDLSLFGRALNIEATYYHALMENQFMSYKGQGGKTVFVNGGKVLNQGIELTTSYILAPNNDFSWKTGVNFSYNTNEILSTAKKSDGKDLKYEVSMGNSTGLKVKFLKGGSYGDLYAVDYMRDETTGKIIINPRNGRPFVKNGQSDKYMGNMNAKYHLGWSNTFNYKDFQFYFLIDGKIGGKVISLTEGRLDYFGTSQRTADARLFAEQNNLVWENKEGDKFPAMYLPDGQLTSIQAYYETMGLLGNNYIYNGTNFRLREISVAYTFRDVFGRSKHLTLSLNARNLFFIYKDAPIDPETSMTTQNALGNVDVFSMPTTRMFGFAIKASF
ncbi:SusC/RagA family TonB-linked outer membrane protein [Coprobacter tertius]|uniref:SusC/RagA family TonB-linked outer membrane protein n=1 Tax=Coprobacter tertius TaxID=2944915 RepID=A0ABT1MD36_9BACT|nr:SusC/RagA family TonB-linked outer membrane protein [Coprobacter tertius]MCP9610550.1 SusC/RagA family TonB-linked outer membrane protein [Coprobacter tertius]